jgi:hypothetical protein
VVVLPFWSLAGSKGGVGDVDLELDVERRVLTLDIFFATTRKVNFLVTCRGTSISSLATERPSPFSSESFSNIIPRLRFLFVSRLFLDASLCIKCLVNKLFTTSFSMGIRIAAQIILSGGDYLLHWGRPPIAWLQSFWLSLHREVNGRNNIG